MEGFFEAVFQCVASPSWVIFNRSSFSSVAESVRVESLPEAFHCWCIVSYIGSPRLIIVEVERFFVVLLLFAHLKNDTISEIRRNDLGRSWIFFKESFIYSCLTGNCKASASLFLSVNRTDSLNR